MGTYMLTGLPARTATRWPEVLAAVPEEKRIDIATLLRARSGLTKGLTKERWWFLTAPPGLVARCVAEVCVGKEKGKGL